MPRVEKRNKRREKGVAEFQDSTRSYFGAEPNGSENCDECSVKYLHAKDNPSSLPSPSKHSLLPADAVAAIFAVF